MSSQKFDLGKLEIVEDLRSVWSNEARHFTPWLAKQENLDLLGEALRMELTVKKVEVSVGAFSADIVAETGEGEDTQIVVIENQLEDSNHDHLGKIITYASGLDAKGMVWVVAQARSEHRQAVKWLNENIKSDVSIFLVEVELWKIDDSKPAPHFNVIEEPNEWERKVKSMASLSATELLKLDFWDHFVKHAEKDASFLSVFPRLSDTRPAHSYTLRCGSSHYSIGLLINTKDKTIGLDLAVWNKDFYNFLAQHREEFLKSTGLVPVWHGDGSHMQRIFVTRSGDIKGNKSNWPEFFAWYCELAPKVRQEAAHYHDLFVAQKA